MLVCCWNPFLWLRRFHYWTPKPLGNSPKQSYNTQIAKRQEFPPLIFVNCGAILTPFHAKLRFYLLDQLCGFCLPFPYAIGVDIACATLSGNDNRTASFPHIPALCSEAGAIADRLPFFFCFVVCCDDWKNNGAVGTASAGIQAFRHAYFAGDRYTDGWFDAGSPLLLQ